MRRPVAACSKADCVSSSLAFSRGSLFQGLSLSFLGFDSESLHLAASTAPAAAVANNHNTDESYESACSCVGKWRVLRIAADAAAARALLHQMEEKAVAEGARVVAASRVGIATTGLFVCNFAAAFAHLRRLADQEQPQLRCVPEEPHQLIEALELEPLRLLTPFWMFACLRDRRVYAPDAHPLFRVSAALTPSQPPLFIWQQSLPSQQQEYCLARKQRVLLLGFTRRRRRVRRASCLGPTSSDSDSDESSRGNDAQSVAGHALAEHDEEIAAACVEALGGCCVTAAEVSCAGEVAASGDLVAKHTGSHSPSEDSRVDLVVVGHLCSLLKSSVPTTGSIQHMQSQPQKRAAAAAAELALLQSLQERGVACVLLQWLLDAYRYGRAPPFELYAVPPKQLQRAPAAPNIAALRRKVLQGTQLLVSDLAVARDPSLLQRVAGLGCTDVTTIPSLLGLCPWLFRSSTTRKLAAVLCGSRDRVQLVNAALQRAEDASQKQCSEPQVLLVLHREETAGLFDLAAVVAETVVTTDSSQLGPARRCAGRAVSNRNTPSHHPSHQQHKIESLVAAAKQRVLQCVTPVAALAVEGHWDSAAEEATSSTTQVDDEVAFSTLRRATATAGTRPMVVVSEWIDDCWEDARRLPIDISYGRIEVPDFWAEGVTDSTGQWEDAALTTVLKNCGGAVVYGDFPVVTDAREARLRRALGALEHALTLSYDVHQHRIGGHVAH